MPSTTTVENITGHVKCGDRACTTGQVILATNNTARKVSSHFFGRNKASTKVIDFHVWHHLCRMTYQRSRYAAEKLGPQALCQYYIDHLKHQFIRLRLWRPDATFTVQLWEPAKKRLNNYHAIVLRGSSKAAAESQVAIAPSISKKNEKPKALHEAEAVTMGHAEYIDEQLAGCNKSIDDIVNVIIPWIQQEVISGAMVQMPPIEFLISSPAEGETVLDPATNFARWEAHVDGREYVEPPAAATVSSPTPRKKLPKLIRLSPPRPPIKLKLRFRRASEEKKTPPPPPPATRRSAGDLPLWQPPSPSVLAALKRKDKKRTLSLDTALSNQYGEGRAPETELGKPVMARGMVFAGAKPKVGPRKRVIDELYDDETASEGEGIGR